MKKISLFVFLFSFLFIISNLLAAESVFISGISLPLVEGALRVPGNGTSNAKVEKFSTDKPLAEVISFYSEYLKANGFLLIGGENASGFDASVKKNESMFTLKIYSEKGKTVVHFVW
jgi:hypothetical protein